MQTADFDYDLPRELIAMHPPAERGGSRLLVMHRSSGGIEHTAFSELPAYLQKGDLLVLNDSKVLRARLRGSRVQTGGAVELLLLKRCPGNLQLDCWNAMARPAKKLRIGEEIRFGHGELHGTVVAVGDEGQRTIQFSVEDILPLLDNLGELPLPAYIVSRRREMLEPASASEQEDSERYQTVFAREPGSVAAPTAGLHFTDSMLEQLSERGVQIVKVTLHVGAGTFKPVEVDDPSEHAMHTETYNIPPDAAAAINGALRENRRVIAVGTTAVRTLESAFDQTTNAMRAGSADTSLLILPGYTFRVVSAVVTNFHLPRSTLLMLVSAFAGRDATLAAYREAIGKKYRFYSYGDAMLLI